MTDETMTLADLRRRTGLSQAQVAERMFVSDTQVSRIEAMYPQVMFPTLRAYLDAIKVDIRFSQAPGLNVLSGEVVADTTRIYAASRRKDPTRGGRRA
ncbi:helix-turn-helix domain-containing protein [Streptomyces sp. DSM 118148]|uniref:helix-turn-helix domain-containing protein n=1 Tax=Streptomyces sp. DSM 118148 TaxID=3448667 RepID=UPI00404010E4